MRVVDVIQLFLLAALWGGSFLFMRIGAPVFGPVWLIELRVLLAGLALLPLLIRLNLWSEVRRKIIPLSVVGCLNSALPYVCLAFASVFLPAGFTSILNATSPLFGIFIAVVWFQEKLSLNRIIGFFFGWIGVSILVGWKAFETTPSFVLAVGIGLLAPVMYAIAAPYAKRQLSDVPPLVIAIMSQLSAAMFLLPALPFTVPKQVPALEIWLSVLALALFSTAIASILYFRLIQNVGATKALTVTYLIPVFAMIWGTLILKEAITPSMVLGCALILIGTAIANELFNPLPGKKL
ncbi:DMT family transporter [Roseofilum sp. Guam]|uniref:DMT family transporter n=1 Tax=Roseofilum sp. Guam TaxID=2821502 RepID=UPI001B218A1F|nr:DMT family transporter [Roseofilum sp. Guam]MBP0030594.1 DMT family transporter [Roseofilum sp. Guam]